jgi:hypothetical protein
VEHANHPASPESPPGGDEFLLRALMGGGPHGGGPPDQFFPGPSGSHSPFPTLLSSNRQSNLQWRQTGPNTMTLTGTIRPGIDNDHPPLGSPAGLFGGLLSSFLTQGMPGGQPPGPAGGGGSNSFTFSSPNGRATVSYRTIRPRDLNNPGAPGPPVGDLFRYVCLENWISSSINLRSAFKFA